MGSVVAPLAFVGGVRSTAAVGVLRRGGGARVVFVGGVRSTAVAGVLRRGGGAPAGKRHTRKRGRARLFTPGLP